MEGHRWIRPLVLIASLATLLGSPGCGAQTEPALATSSATGSPTPQPSANLIPSPSPSMAAPVPSAPAAPRMAKWIELKAGNCLAELPPSDPAIVMVTVVDCATPHLAEAYLRANVPVNAAVTDTANRECDAGFPTYTGRPAAGGAYTVTYLIDSDQDRTSNNPYPSTVICLLQGSAGQTLTGSASR